MNPLFDFLLRLYPSEHRALLGEEIRSVLRERAQDSRARGAVGRVAFAMQETSGLLAGLVAEWAAKLTAFDAYLIGAHPLAAGEAVPHTIIESEGRVRFLCDRIEYAIAHHDFEGARLYCREEARERERLLELKRFYADKWNVVRGQTRPQEEES